MTISPLCAVLSTGLGRRAWREHMKGVVDACASREHKARENLHASSIGRGDGSLTQWERVPLAEAEEPTAAVIGLNSSGSEIGSVVGYPDQPIWSREQPGAIEETASRLSGEQNIGDRDEKDANAHSAVAALFLALDILSTGGGSTKREGYLDARKCIEFSAGWPSDKLPAFLVPSLLQPVWSAADQVGWFRWRKGDGYLLHFRE